MSTLFRYLVVISTILFIIAWLMPIFDHNWLSEESQRILAVSGYGSKLPTSVAIYWGQFAIWLSISVGLFFFLKIARFAFLVALFASTVAQFFWGFSVYPSYEAALNTIIAMSDGAILTMAYLTTVSRKFENVS